MINRLLNRYIRNAEDRRWLGILIDLAVLAIIQGAIYVVIFPEVLR